MLSKRCCFFPRLASLGALSIVITALLSTGCTVRRDSEIQFAENRTAIAPDQVLLLEDPPAQFRVVAQVEATTVGIFANRKQALDSAVRDLKKQAGSLGANAVILDTPLAASTDPDEIHATEITGVAIFMEKSGQ